MRPSTSPRSGGSSSGFGDAAMARIPWITWITRITRTPVVLLALPLFLTLLGPEPTAGPGGVKILVDGGIVEVEGEVVPDEGAILCAGLVDEALRMCAQTLGCVRPFVEDSSLRVCPPID